jgi:hypothetical protein
MRVWRGREKSDIPVQGKSLYRSMWRSDGGNSDVSVQRMIPLQEQRI